MKPSEFFEQSHKNFKASAVSDKNQVFCNEKAFIETAPDIRQEKKPKRDPNAYKIFGKRMGREVWIVCNQEMKEKILLEKDGLPVFTQAEVRAISKETPVPVLDLICDFKEVFQESSVVSCEVLDEIEKVEEVKKHQQFRLG